MGDYGPLFLLSVQVLKSWTRLITIAVKYILNESALSARRLLLSRLGVALLYL
jgi:hypothetical protein